MAKKIRKIVTETEDYRRVAILDGTEIHIYDEVKADGLWESCFEENRKILYPNEVYAIVDILFAILESPEEHGKIMDELAEKMGGQ